MTNKDTYNKYNQILQPTSRLRHLIIKLILLVIYHRISFLTFFFIKEKKAGRPPEEFKKKVKKGEDDLLNRWQGLLQAPKARGGREKDLLRK